MAKKIDKKKACGYCIYGNSFGHETKCEKYLAYLSSNKRKDGGSTLLAQKCKKFYSSQGATRVLYK